MSLTLTCLCHTEPGWSCDVCQPRSYSDPWSDGTPLPPHVPGTPPAVPAEDDDHLPGCTGLVCADDCPRWLAYEAGADERAYNGGLPL